MRIKKIKKLLEKEEGYKAGLFAQKVREVCDNWFYANENILRKDFEVDYTRSLDDCFLIRNPYNNYETPVMEIYLLKPQKNRFLFFKQKSLIMARIRLVGLFLTDEKPIFEVADKESLEVATSLIKSGCQIKLSNYRLSETEEFISGVIGNE